MSGNTTEYYRKRAAEEQRLAAAAINPAIGIIHLEMAERYIQLAEQSARIPRLRVSRPA